MTGPLQPRYASQPCIDDIPCRQMHATKGRPRSTQPSRLLPLLDLRVQRCVV